MNRKYFFCKTNKLFWALFFVTTFNSLIGQTYTVKADSFGWVILYKDEKIYDYILNGPGIITQYKVIDEKNIVIIKEIAEITEYLNLKFVNNSWIITDSNVRWIESQSWPYKKITYKLLGEDKVEKYENGISIGLVDFSKIIERNVKRKKEMQEYMKNYKESKKNKK